MNHVVVENLFSEENAQINASMASTHFKNETSGNQFLVELTETVKTLFFKYFGSQYFDFKVQGVINYRIKLSFDECAEIIQFDFQQTLVNQFVPSENDSSVLEKSVLSSILVQESKLSASQENKEKKIETESEEIDAQCEHFYTSSNNRKFLRKGHIQVIGKDLTDDFVNEDASQTEHVNVSLHNPSKSSQVKFFSRLLPDIPKKAITFETDLTIDKKHYSSSETESETETENKESCTQCDSSYTSSNKSLRKDPIRLFGEDLKDDYVNEDASQTENVNLSLDNPSTKAVTSETDPAIEKNNYTARVSFDQFLRKSLISKDLNYGDTTVSILNTENEKVYSDTSSCMVNSIRKYNDDSCIDREHDENHTKSVEDSLHNDTKATNQKSNKYYRIIKNKKSTTSHSEKCSDNNKQIKISALGDHKYNVDNSDFSTLYSTKCRICGLSFMGSSYSWANEKRVWHEKTHGLSKKAVSFSIFSRQHLIRKQGLKSHANTQSEKPFKSNVCDKSSIQYCQFKKFIEKSLLYNHLSSHIPPIDKKHYSSSETESETETENKESCTQCDSSYTSCNKSLKKGPLQVFGEDLKDDYVNDDASQTEHVNLSLDNPSTKGPLQVLFTSIPPNSVKANDLSSNVNRNSEIALNRKVCRICGKSFKWQASLIYHFKKSHAETHDEKIVNVCHICGKSFKSYYVSQDVFERHVKSHSGEKPYKCDICGKTFAQQRFLKQHLNHHSGDLPYKCEICKRQFLKPQNLRDHVQIHSEHRKMCTICVKSFSSRFTLLQHLRKVHGENKYKYKCSFCGRFLYDKESLQRHERLHTGKRDTCEICGKSVTNLRTHKRMHRMKKFKCQQCGKDFLERHSLESHKMVHSGEKPFQCRVCGKSFIKKYRLKAHAKKH